MRRKVHAAIDLHTGTSLLGWMSTNGDMLGMQRFATTETNLREHVKAIEARQVTLTIEASGLMRWASRILRPLVSRLIICEPRYNKSISHSPKKSDEFDVEQLCRLERMDELHEVWLGEDDQRDTFRAAVYDMLRFRDRHRELQALIKTRYQGLGILSVAGNEPLHPLKRERWIDMVPRAQRHGLLLNYDAFDLAYGAWAEQVREVIRLGRAYPEIPLFMEVPGIGEIGAHTFSAMVEDPRRFSTAKELYRFCALAITSRTSDGKPLGYERLDRTGRRELKTVSYHAWRVGCRSNQKCDVIRRFYFASKERTGTARHGRLNTQRKILKTLWTMWKNHTHFDPNLFLQTPEPEPAGRRARRRRRRRTRSPKC